MYPCLYIQSKSGTGINENNKIGGVITRKPVDGKWKNVPQGGKRIASRYGWSVIRKYDFLVASPLTYQPKEKVENKYYHQNMSREQ